MAEPLTLVGSHSKKIAKAFSKSEVLDYKDPSVGWKRMEKRVPH